MTEMDAINTYEAKPRTLWQRLGFGTCSTPDMDDLEDVEGFAPAYLESVNISVLDWRDRLRVLVSGKVMVVIAAKTDVVVRRAMSRGKISVLPPNHPLPSVSEPTAEGEKK